MSTTIQLQVRLGLEPLVDTKYYWQASQLLGSIVHGGTSCQPACGQRAAHLAFMPRCVGSLTAASYLEPLRGRLAAVIRVGWNNPCMDPDLAVSSTTYASLYELTKLWWFQDVLLTGGLAPIC